MNEYVSRHYSRRHYYKSLNCGSAKSPIEVTLQLTQSVKFRQERGYLDNSPTASRYGKTEANDALCPLFSKDLL